MRSVRGDAAPSPLLCLLPPSIATPYPALSVSRSFAEAKKLAKVRRSGCIIYHVLLQSDLDPIPFDLNVNSMQKKCSSAQLSINGDMICERKLTNKQRPARLTCCVHRLSKFGPSIYPWSNALEAAQDWLVYLRVPGSPSRLLCFGSARPDLIEQQLVAYLLLPAACSRCRITVQRRRYARTVPLLPRTTRVCSPAARDGNGLRLRAQKRPRGPPASQRNPWRSQETGGCRACPGPPRLEAAQSWLRLNPENQNYMNV